MNIATKVTLDGVLDRVRVPFQRELKIFDERTGGVEHVSLDNMAYGRDLIADWIAETFAETLP